jgi:hypothetical protein
MAFPFALLIVGPFVAFATNQPYTREHHPIQSILGAFVGGMMFTVGAMVLVDVVLFSR